MGGSSSRPCHLACSARPLRGEAERSAFPALDCNMMTSQVLRLISWVVKDVALDDPLVGVNFYHIQGKNQWVPSNRPSNFFAEVPT